MSCNIIVMHNCQKDSAPGIRASARGTLAQTNIIVMRNCQKD